MIAHVSIPSPTPRETAKTLARLLGSGKVMQFAPLGREGYVVYSGTHAHEGVMVEVIDDRLRHVPGESDEEPCSYARVVSGGEKDRHYLSHIAITTPLSEEEIFEIARQVGWRAVTCWRGSAFPQTEVWVDNRYMIEFMSPDQCEKYRESMNPDAFAAMFRMSPAEDGVLEPDPAIEQAIREVRSQMAADRKRDIAI